MKKEPSGGEVDLIIPMLPDIEVAATKTAVAIAEYMEFNAEKIDELKLALIEACINAFEHSKSKDKKLYIKFVMQGNELTVIIKDNGKGFDMLTSKDGIGLENIKRRAEMFSGKCKFKSSPGNGCELMVELPLKTVSLKSAEKMRLAANVSS